MKKLQPSAAGRWLALACLGLYGALAIFGMAREGQTFDEGAHLSAGYSYLTTRDFRLNPEHPPLAKLWAALPLKLMSNVRFSTHWREWVVGDQWRVGQRFLYLDNDANRLLFFGRIPILILSCCLGLYIYRWTCALVGVAGGCLAVAMFALTPDFLAHGSLVTTDAPVSAFLFIAGYYLWRSLQRLSVSDVVKCGLALGAALATKFSALVFVPLCVVLPLARALHSAPLLADARLGELATRRQRCLALLGACVLAGLCALGVIWAAYGFGGSVTKLPPTVTGGRAGLFALLPLPDTYLLGLHSALAQSGQRVAFLFGKRADWGFRYYFVISFLVKTPLPELILIGAGWWLAVVRGARGAWVYLGLLLAVVYYAAISLTAHLNIGHRHLLPLYPFSIVLAACCATLLLERVWTRVVLAALYAWLAFGTLSVAPSFLAYFNELAGGTRGGMEFLVDSNLDWGQDLPGLKRWMDAHAVKRIYLSYFGTAMPEFYGIDYLALPSFMQLSRPLATTIDLSASEYVAVSATNLQKVYMDAAGAPRAFEEFLDYLREKREPEVVIGGSIYVYKMKRRHVEPRR